MYRDILCSFLAIGLLFASTVEAQTPRRRPNPSLAPIEDVPGLPRVLIIGDSISIGYTLPLREELKGKANLHRIPTNGGPTTRGLESIDNWIGDKPWDVIHFNWGLHDLKYMNDKGQLVAPSEGHQQVPPDEYKHNLEKLVQRLEKTGAKLIWRNTTPIPEGSQGRVPGDEVKYNEIAAKIMRSHDIPTDDHYSFVKPQIEALMLPANVHFTKEGYAALAKQAAKAIEIRLKE
ncbi:MAG: SGNH/GDSL hydrolase family protein [Planctomycetaceae bacterium]|nr:SGNH/GDSL hydrolase family protein [Planctomycetaceae bacterium]